MKNQNRSSKFKHKLRTKEQEREWFPMTERSVVSHLIRIRNFHEKLSWLGVRVLIRMTEKYNDRGIYQQTELSQRNQQMWVIKWTQFVTVLFKGELVVSFLDLRRVGALRNPSERKRGGDQKRDLRKWREKGKGIRSFTRGDRSSRPHRSR